MFTAITNFVADVKAGYEAMVSDTVVAIDNAKFDVANNCSTIHAPKTVVYRVVYSVAAAFLKAMRWTYSNDINLNITAAVLSLPLLPVAFGYINVATVIAMVLSFVAITELFVPVSANLGLSAKVVRTIGYSAAVVKAAIVLGFGAFFM